MTEEERQKLEDEKKKILKLLQSLILAAKGGIPLDRLNRKLS